MEKEILNFKEFIAYCGISKSRGYKATFQRELPFYKPNNGSVYFKIEDIKNWILQNRQDSLKEISAKSKIKIDKNN